VLLLRGALIAWLCANGYLYKQRWIETLVFVVCNSAPSAVQFSKAHANCTHCSLSLITYQAKQKSVKCHFSHFWTLKKNVKNVTLGVQFNR